MELEIEESILVGAVSRLKADEQQQFFATMKALLGLPLNLRETLSVSQLTTQLTEESDRELVAVLESRLVGAMQLAG
jgi:ubiquinone biosynthesis protein COQ9